MPRKSVPNAESIKRQERRVRAKERENAVLNIETAMGAITLDTSRLVATSSAVSSVVIPSINPRLAATASAVPRDAVDTEESVELEYLTHERSDKDFETLEEAEAYGLKRQDILIRREKFIKIENAKRETIKLYQQTLNNWLKRERLDKKYGIIRYGNTDYVIEMHVMRSGKDDGRRGQLYKINNDKTMGYSIGDFVGYGNNGTIIYNEKIKKNEEERIKKDKDKDLQELYDAGLDIVEEDGVEYIYSEEYPHEVFTISHRFGVSYYDLDEFVGYFAGGDARIEFTSADNEEKNKEIRDELIRRGEGETIKLATYS
jgi:hypothetical protein